MKLKGSPSLLFACWIVLTITAYIFPVPSTAKTFERSYSPKMQLVGWFGERSAKANYPVHRLVGSMRKEPINWEVLEIFVNFEHEKFNLWNWESYLQIKVLEPTDENSFYNIKRLHINQRYKKENEKNIALIEITPVFSLDEIKYQNNEAKEILDLNIEEPIHNRGWGRNFYRVVLGKKHIDLKTLQRK